MQTPIVKMNQNIGSANIYVKREDLLPFSFGGNKVRIAQEYYADMCKKRKNSMICYGNARSNLCRVIANICHSRGIVCHIISPSEEDGTRIETSNSRIARNCGAIFHPCNKNKVCEAVEDVILECDCNGLYPYYIYGDKYGKGNESVPVRAYVKVYDEIKQQSQHMGIQFDFIFLAIGTGMTQAGLIAGRQLNKGSEKIVGISVSRKKEQELRILATFVETYFHSLGIELPLGELEIIDDYLCGGYGKYDDAIVNIIKETLIQEGMPLDPTYTGKAFYGMLRTIEKEKIKGNILFIHTGGTPLFFDIIELLK